MQRRRIEHMASFAQCASVGSVRNSALASACPAFDGIDFAARQYRLHHDGEARSVASNARMFFDFGRHIEPFQAALSWRPLEEG